MTELNLGRPRLQRAEDVYRPQRGASLAEWAFRKFPPVFVDRPMPDLGRRGRLSNVTTSAEVNQGRWVARCPFCPSAQVVSPADPRFLCAGSDGCANAPVEGAFVGVVFPDETRRTEIEAALLARPETNRNWTRTETVAALIEENAVNGLDYT